MTNILSDPAAERAVLAGICAYSDKAYFEVSDILTETCFTIDSNVLIYKCLKHMFDKGHSTQIDVACIMSAAQELELSHVLSKKEEAQHLKAIIDFPVSLDNIRKFAAKVKKLDIARLLHKQLKLAQDRILDINGSESITSILGIAEDTVFDFTNKLNDSETGPEAIGNNLEEYIQYLEEHKVDQVGISTGFKIYDQAIGGGLRKGTVNVIAARPKVGKTLLSDNMGFHIANKSQIPVLNMDINLEQTHCLRHE